MYHIYDYVDEVEDGLAVRLMLNPDQNLTQPIMLESDSSLLVQPMKIQPPTHIVFSYLEGNQRRTEWLCQIPWRIEVLLMIGCYSKIEVTLNTGQSSVYDVDTEVSLLTANQMNPLFNRDEISIRGLLFDVDTQEERPIKVPIGSILHAYLYVGTDCVENRGSYCDVRDIDTTSEWVKFACENEKRTDELSDECIRGVSML